MAFIRYDCCPYKKRRQGHRHTYTEGQPREVKARGQLGAELCLPNSYVEALSPTVMVSEDRASERLLRLKEVLRVAPWSDRTGAL